MDAELDRAAAILKSGGLVAIPTETVYGLAANALDADAVARIFAAKQRPLTSPLIVHVSDVQMARSLAAEWPELAAKLAEAFWPGPLTIVVRKSASVPSVISAGLDTVGLRMPKHRIALELIRRSGVPLAAPSANLFMQLSPTTAEHVRRGLGDRVDMVVDGGPSEVGIESTVVSVVGEPRVLRLGMISAERLETATGVRWTLANVADAPAHLSPGQHDRHYAPRTPFYVLSGGQAAPAGHGVVLELPDDAESYAAQLYEALHAADGCGYDWIAVREVPSDAAWDAIRDRLKRAATSL